MLRRVSLAGALALSLSSCAYRFTNLYLNPPPHLRSIAVEAVYDTTRMVLPHEILWENLQRAAAADGHFTLAPPEGADLYLRAHLHKGERRLIDVYKAILPREPEDIMSPAFVDPIRPSVFGLANNLQLATEISHRELIRMRIRVEVWHIATQSLVFSRDYPIEEVLKVQGIDTDGVANRHLHSEEVFEIRFDEVTQGISTTAIRDLLISLAR